MEFLKVFLTTEAAISFAITILTTTLSIIFAKTKSAKVRKAAGIALTITDEVKHKMLDAEKFKNYSGAEKLEFVLSRMQTFLAQKKLTYDEELIKNIIENEITLTKQINSRPKDAETQTTP